MTICGCDCFFACDFSLNLPHFATDGNFCYGLNPGLNSNKHVVRLNDNCCSDTVPFRATTLDPYRGFHNNLHLMMKQSKISRSDGLSIMQRDDKITSGRNGDKICSLKQFPALNNRITPSWCTRIMI